MPKPFRTMLLNDQALHLIRSAASLRKIRPILMAIAFMSAVAAQVPDSNAVMGFRTPTAGSCEVCSPPPRHLQLCVHRATVHWPSKTDSC